MSRFPFQTSDRADTVFLSDDDPRGRSRILNAESLGDAKSQSHFHAALTDLTLKALRLTGREAMLSPKREAALHEAGHAVFCTAIGIEINSVSIFRIDDKTHQAAAAAFAVEEGFWGGATYAPLTWRSDPCTSPGEDLLCASNWLAGWCGEWAHNLNAMRIGSSLDEIVLAQMAVSNAARKTGEAQEVLFAEQLAAVVGVLRANRAPHENLAARLMRKSTIGPNALKQLLQGVHMRAPGAP